MKCAVCGTESEFDAAFIKERESFGFGHKTVCPACWIHRRDRRASRWLVVVLLTGIAGCLLLWIKPAHPHSGSLLLDSAWTFFGNLFRNLFLLDLFLVLSILPHELGHAMAGRLVGWRVFQITVGVGKPLFRRRWFGILFDFRLLPIGGLTYMTPANLRWFRSKRFLTVLAGPAVNAAFAAIVLWYGSLGGLTFGELPIPVRLFVWANFWIMLVNLWPHQAGGVFNLPSDGKQLLQALSFRKKDAEELQALRYSFEALMCREEKDLAGARTWCDQGLALFPDNVHLLNTSGINYLDQQRYEPAREVFASLLAKADTPGNRFLFMNNIAYADALAGKPEWLAEADAYSRDAYVAVPWVPAIVGTRGTVLVALGQFDEGLKLLKKSLEDAGSPVSKAENACHVAIALARMGNFAEARRYLELARQLDLQRPLIARAEREVNLRQTEPERK